MPIKSIEEIDAAIIVEQSKGVVEAQKQVRISLAADWPRAVELSWNPGGRNGRTSIIKLEPGKSVVQPLDKAQAWFGPFSIPLEFANETSDTRKQFLREFYATEKARYLNRYDYPRTSNKDMAPTGHHRSPDVTVTILEADGSEGEPIRLYELYKIGEWDALKESFAIKTSPEEMATRHQAELDERDLEVGALRRQVAEMAGLLKGFMAAKESS